MQGGLFAHDGWLRTLASDRTGTLRTSRNNPPRPSCSDRGQRDTQHSIRELTAACNACRELDGGEFRVPYEDRRHRAPHNHPSWLARFSAYQVLAQSSLCIEAHPILCTALLQVRIRRGQLRTLGWFASTSGVKPSPPSSAINYVAIPYI